MLQRTLKSLCALLLFGSFAQRLCAAEPAASLPPAAPRAVDFAEDVRPILARACYSCHGPGKQESSLRLDVKSAALKGGDNGTDILPGDSAKSPLVRMVAGLEEGELMPAKGPRLTAAEIGILRAWIDQGAKWPDGIDAAKLVDKSDFWSFKTAPRPKPPELDRDPWIRTPIDAFILAKLKQLKLSPSPEADRRTLIRRLYFDLTGLPPRPAEVDAFVADPSPTAYEKLVDRLLASPAYGETWGRHWLDVVHFGETHGYDKDKPRPNAWRYRDYVIQSFNQDSPYDRFVQEQLAGDVLFPDDPIGPIATGFLAAGPWDYVGHVELREGTKDKLITRSLDRDDMVMATMSTFQSLTVHCARCHDHKFDPITQQDYYRLQAVFAGVDRKDRLTEHDQATRLARIALNGERQQLERTLAILRAKLGDRAPDQVIGLAARNRTQFVAAPPADLVQKTLGYHSQIMDRENATKWVQVDLGESVPIDRVFLVPVYHTYSGYVGPGWGFPPRFRIEASDDADFKSPHVLADETTQDFRNPGNRPYVADGTGWKARYVRVTATKLFPRTGDFIFALGELIVTSHGKNVAAGCPVSALDSIEIAPSWGSKFLVDHESILSHLLPIQSPSNGYHSGIEPRSDVEKWVQVDLGQAMPIEQIRMLPALPVDFKFKPGFGFPVRFRVSVSNDPTFAQSQILSDWTGNDFANPGDRPVEVEGGLARARYVRITATRLWKRYNDFVFALGELQVFSDGRNVALGAAVRSLDSIEAGRWAKTYLTDGYTSRTRAERSGDWIELLIAEFRPTGDSVARSRTIAAPAESAAYNDLLQQWKQAASRLDQVRRKLDALPPMVKAYSVVPLSVPRPIAVLARGDVSHPGVAVGSGTLKVLSSGAAEFRLADPGHEGSRRAALARAITDPNNLLTRRSIVNRVWQYHFGRGIVDSPNDFGHMGALPTHPELLDWLAYWFLDNGQSLKKLHRLILCSSAYRQSSMSDPQKALVDADNRFLWRMNRQRLDAEAIHDTVLAISERLDPTMGGPSVQQFYFKDDHSPVYDYSKYDQDSPGNRRRSIYRFVVRSVPDPFMECLDCPDPSMLAPKRTATFTALQALAMNNNPFVLRHCEHLATRLRNESPDLQGQIVLAYRLILQRDPRTEEAKILTDYAAKHGLTNLCRVLLNSNEFAFVD